MIGVSIGDCSTVHASGRNEAGRNGAAWRRVFGVAGVVLAAGLPLPASAQSADCDALRARIDAAGPAPEAAVAIRQSRAELDRVRVAADQRGCTGGSVFDDPDPPECHALLQRAEDLRGTIARLSGSPQGDGDADRRAAIEDYRATCTGGGADAAGPTPDALVPVDPDAPADQSAPAAPASRIARVLCVRHCDGAYYPLAVDVPTDKLEGMSQLCQAQCPNAEASAYADHDGDVSKAAAADGTPYTALPAAFQFEKAASPTCACRAPGESWAQTLAKAQAMIEAQPGDVVVTPEVQARMGRPQPAPEAKPAAAKPAKAAAKRTKAAPPPALDAGVANPGLDLTRAFRRSVPTL